MPLTVTDCVVTNTSITISFSDPVFTKTQVTAALGGTQPGWSWPKPSGMTKADLAAWEHGPLNPTNYSISDPGSADFQQPLTLAKFIGPTLPTTLPASPAIISERTLTISFVAQGTPPAKNYEFGDGDWVNIVLKHIHGLAEPGDPVPAFEGDFVMIARQVAGRGKAARITKDVEDAISYPILTEEVGYPPAVTSRPGPGAGFGSGGGGNQGLGQIAARAIGDALGWKPNSTDAKGFVGALTQSFSLTEVEGHIESKWNQRTYTVQSDLAGVISGAQASLYARAKVAMDNCLPLIDGLYPLDPTADPEFVRALKEMAKSQIAEIVKQFGVVPPSILRVNTYFRILMGVKSFRFNDDPRVEADPDKIKGTLGSLRDTYGIWFQQNGGDNEFNNSVQDETDITNFRMISDYMTGLLQSWLANGKYFMLNTSRLPAFLGTQLVLISRQLGVIAETVNELRFALDSVFIGPNERQTLLLEFDDHWELPAMYLEDVLTEIESSCTDELPRLIKDGGRIAITNNLLPVVQTLMNMVQAAHDPMNIDALPDGFSTARVRHALDDLSDQLTQLFTQGQQVGMQIPEPLELEVQLSRRGKAQRI
ncbi:MAG: hypothetical protein ABSB39_23105 [Candidatus Sulfotelmatobacter sp.]|jgi:hypothetical protein